MNLRRLLPALILLLTLGRPAFAAEAQKPGYKVMVDIACDETGTPESARVAESEDFSGDSVLNQIALNLAREIKQAPQLKDGKPVKFTVRAPFNFPVEGDEGADANKAPKPSIHSAVKPAYPENLAAQGTVGGAVLELIIGVDGQVKEVKTLRASHPEFGVAAASALKQWVFTPAMSSGAPVESRWRLVVGFSVNGQDPDWKWRVAPRPSLGAYTVVRAKLPPPAVAPAVTVPAQSPGK